MSGYLKKRCWIILLKNENKIKNILNKFLDGRQGSQKKFMLKIQDLMGKLAKVS